MGRMRKLQSHKGNNYFANRDTHPGSAADGGKERWKRTVEKAAKKVSEKSSLLLYFSRRIPIFVLLPSTHH
jgi:hypothetical protein